MSESGDRTQILYKRKQIKNALIAQNIKYYTKVMEIKLHQDKIYKSLQNNEVRDRILNKDLRREEYEDQDIFNFFTLLKRNKENQISKDYEPITKTE